MTETEWGPTVLTSGEMAEFEARLAEPPNPTPAAREGQAMLKEWVADLEGKIAEQRLTGEG